MRVAGALTVVFGWIVAAIFFLLPAEVSILATTGSCGTPVVTALDRSPVDADSDLQRALVRECRARSKQRTVVGLAVAAIATVGGAAMLLLPSSRN